VIRAPGHDPLPVTLPGRFFVGRACDGVDPGSRHLVDDPEVSRNHLELRIEGRSGRVVALDLSTNGTRLNGALLERAVPTPVRHADRLTLGQVEIEVLGAPDLASDAADKSTLRRGYADTAALVAGDVIGYSAMSQKVESDVLIETVGRLFALMRPLLGAHGGTLGHYAGDAFLGVWTAGDDRASARSAVRFALAADAAVRALPPLAGTGGVAVRMGWGVTLGPTAITSMSGPLITVLGDTVNVAFRVADLAGREGRAPVLASSIVRDLTAEEAEFGAGASYEVKGRTGSELLHAVRPRA
jgi:adenylate cyclase